MRHAVLALLLVACKSEPAPTPAKPPPVKTAPAGGCNDAHDCVLRDVCGCSCEGVLLSEGGQVACDESCPNKHVCDGYSLICDLALHRCGAIPRSP